MFSNCHLKLYCMLIMIALASNGAHSQDDRFVELINVCSGQDLLHVITRVCSMHRKRRSLSLSEQSYAGGPPRSIPIQDVAKVCCKVPCRMSLFLRLCFPIEER